ncbi:MAG: hypothetical protein KA191_01460 [Verrucomicrobia bacterium]|jgi:uncharacterized repeat protein (TIGR04138 family)|nr:hypothetical protein [Verrucomicrobiota bacterium]OQC66542.1 MAG: hypothetical protein BWX48_01504 [Verrucomicrobia bacterium ADurb.Bin006]MDI9382001.1 hypothetical protein [Verrucomicrobiota bacterium]NMD18706.1 hypothetical protein [Verrucomicrobiota bacterium]HNV00279.1 hypothetical protein [Verrucomicrobiota bacterium]
MRTENIDEILDRVTATDPRYRREAYHFLREALDYTQRAISKSNRGKLRHITGQELLAGIRAYALAQYGPMALTLFHEWGVRSCADFGELVFNLVDQNVLGKTETDSRADFLDGYDFEEAFLKPFRPRSRPGSRVSPRS